MDDRTIIRLPALLARSGKGRSATYADIQTGLMTRPIRIGARAVGWPANEVAAINAARIAGTGDAGIRELVQRLHKARERAAIQLMAA